MKTYCAELNAFCTHNFTTIDILATCDSHSIYLCNELPFDKIRYPQVSSLLLRSFYLDPDYAHGGWGQITKRIDFMRRK